jgi:predicted phage-related endonuclease
MGATPLVVRAARTTNRNPAGSRHSKGLRNVADDDGRALNLTTAGFTFLFEYSGNPNAKGPAMNREQRPRADRVTASFLPHLMAGDEVAIYRKWLELIGDPAWTPEDLNEEWPVQFGKFAEPFVLDWHERKTRRELTRRQEVILSPTYEWLSCTLDAYRADDDTVIDCKVSGSNMRIDDIVARYASQLAIQRHCCNAGYGSILLVLGGGEPQEIFVHSTAEYDQLVLDVAEQFWRCVEDLQPPVIIKHPPPPDRWRTINLNNEADRAAHNWAGQMIELLGEWRATREHHTRHEEAKASIKSLTPDDAGRVHYQGVTIRRSRNRAITILEKE